MIRGLRSWLWIAATMALVGHASAGEVVAVVSSKSSIASLSSAQLEDIFLGRASQAPGGGRVVPVDQAEDSAARGDFYSRVAGKSAAQMKAYWSKIIFTGRGQPPREVRDSAELKRRIAKDSTLIGYIDASLVDDTVKVVRIETGKHD